MLSRVFRVGTTLVCAWPDGHKRSSSGRRPRWSCGAVEACHVAARRRIAGFAGGSRSSQRGWLERRGVVRQSIKCSRKLKKLGRFVRRWSRPWRPWRWTRGPGGEQTDEQRAEREKRMQEMRTRMAEVQKKLMKQSWAF